MGIASLIAEVGIQQIVRLIKVNQSTRTSIQSSKYSSLPGITNSHAVPPLEA